MAAREVYFTVEYAKTNRSSCYKTKVTIPAGALRIGRNAPSPFHDGFVTQWFLPKPFFQKYGKDITSASTQFHGFSSLRPNDQTKLKAMAGEKVEATQSTPEIENLWAVKDYLAKSVSLKELKANLEHNEVSAQGGQDTLIDRVADGLLFGKATCTTCENKGQCQLKYSDGIFKCKTELQWGLCGYEGTEVVIHPWKRNEDLVAIHPFLNKFSTTPMTRPLKKVVKKIGTYKRDEKRPLRGMKFSLVGYIGVTHTEMADHIRKHGGTYFEQIAPEVDYVVTSYPAFLANGPKIQKAMEYQLALVAPLLIHRLILEFGFDQSPYLIAGPLPQIARATLEGPEPVREGGLADSESQLPPPGTIHPEARAPNGKIAIRDGIAYDIMMTMTDAHDGSNKFYLLQIIDVDGNGKIFKCFRKWGRVGTTVGGNLVSSASGWDSTFDIFEEQYLDKAGFPWEQRDTASKKPGKYFPIAVEVVTDTGPVVDDALPSFLEPKVRDLVDLIFDVDMMTREIKSLEFDVRKMPLGKLSRAQISAGYSVLTKIEEVLNSSNVSENQLTALSSQFYTLIPTDFGKNKVTIIDSFDILTKKMRQLEALLDIQIASSLMSDSILGMHPSDQNYKKLGAILKPLSDFSREFKLIKRYIDNSHDAVALGYKVKLTNLYSVSRPGEREEFSPFKMIRPRKLLWHGSRLCNFVGILNQGLRIAPPEAPTTGYLFGKGIYFADRISKSAPFCQPSKTNTTGLLLLCDVAVGNPYEVKKPEFITQLPEGKQSTLVLSKMVPDPNKNETAEEQVVVPSGPSIPTNLQDVFVQDQEYVVYQRQSQIRYLVQVKFEFS